MAKKVTKKKVAKKAVKKKAATKKAAAKQSIAKKPAKQKASGKSGCVIARVDVGWGNSLYIRGNGADLSWAKGVHMTSSTANEWLWTSPQFKSNFEFKILINDVYWSEGDNYDANVNKVTIVSPTF